MEFGVFALCERLEGIAAKERRSIERVPGRPGASPARRVAGAYHPEGPQGHATGFGTGNGLSDRPGGTVMRALLCLTVAATLALEAGTAKAQTAAGSWPNRTITWVVPFAAGGVTDLISRKIAELLRERLGQPVVVRAKSTSDPPAPAPPSTSPARCSRRPPASG
jgi:hypothetical protein